MSAADRITMRFLHHFPDFSLDVEMELPARGVSAIFGPSGSGKTTLLRCIAGLEQAQQGFLNVDGETWQDSNTFLPTYRRPVGYVFQEAGLFPHLNAMDNVRYAMDRAGSARPFWSWLRRRQHQQSADSIAMEEAIDLLGLEHLLHRYPHQLSGGERQRVAIARALLIQPRLLLMDEPLAALDLGRKQEILPYLEALHRRLTIPIIYVSHSMEEIMRLADYLVHLKDGLIVSQGALGETLAATEIPLVSGGDEMGVVLEGVVSELDQRWHLARVDTGNQELWIPAGGLDLEQSVRLRVLASDVSLALSRHEDSSFLNIWSARVTDITSSDTGSTLVRLNADGLPLLACLTSRSIHRLRLEVGSPVWVQIKSVAILR